MMSHQSLKNDNSNNIFYWIPKITANKFYIQNNAGSDKQRIVGENPSVIFWEKHIICFKILQNNMIETKIRV